MITAEYALKKVTYENGIAFPDIKYKI